MGAAIVDADIEYATRLLGPKQIRSIDLALTRTVSLWVGAVSAGKTIASLFAFLFAIIKVPRNELVVIIGQTIQTIEQNVLNPLMDPALFGRISGLVYHTPGASYAIILGRRVDIIGAYNKAAERRIRGGTYALVYVDEATLLPLEFWKMLLTRLRTANPHLIATTNPASRNHWLRKDYILSADDHDMIVFHLTMRDNPLYFPGGKVGPSYIERMERSFSGVFYQRFILGLWTTAEGAIYGNWSRSVHVVAWEAMPPIGEVLALGIDHGTTNPTSCIMLGITDERDAAGRPTPRLILIGEWRYDSTKPDPETGIAPPKLTNAEQSAELRKWLNRKDHIPSTNPGHGIKPRYVFVDPAAADFREQLTRDKIGNSPADNAVKEGISEISSLLTQGLKEGMPRLIVCDRCEGFLEEVTEYVWDPDASEDGKDEPVKAFDHSLDAARYAIRSTRSIWRARFKAAYGIAA